MVDLSDTPRPGAPSPEQLRYAGILGVGVKAGFFALIAGFAAALTGALPLQVPFETLSRLWTLPVGDYLREAGVQAGWNWLAPSGKGDVLGLAGIALLAGVSIPCLLALVPFYAARKDWKYLVITLLLTGVLTLAASGVLVSH